MEKIEPIQQIKKRTPLEKLASKQINIQSQHRHSIHSKKADSPDTRNSRSRDRKKNRRKAKNRHNLDTKQKLQATQKLQAYQERQISILQPTTPSIPSSQQLLQNRSKNNEKKFRNPEKMTDRNGADKNCRDGENKWSDGEKTNSNDEQNKVGSGNEQNLAQMYLNILGSRGFEGWGSETKHFGGVQNELKLEGSFSQRMPEKANSFEENPSLALKQTYNYGLYSSGAAHINRLPQQHHYQLPNQYLNKLPQQHYKLPQQPYKLPQQSYKLPQQYLYKLPQQTLYKLPQQSLYKLPQQHLYPPYHHFSQYASNLGYHLQNHNPSSFGMPPSFEGSYQNNSQGGSSKVQRGYQTQDHSSKCIDHPSKNPSQPQDSGLTSQSTTKIRTNVRSEKERYFKTRLCGEFKAGRCGKSKQDCTFAHGQADLRRVKSNNICHNFQRGICRKTDLECKYVHVRSNETEPVVKKREYIIPNYTYFPFLNYNYMDYQASSNYEHQASHNYNYNNNYDNLKGSFYDYRGGSSNEYPSTKPGLEEGPKEIRRDNRFY